MNDWISLLRKALVIEGSQAALADRLGYHRSTISRALAGTYQADTDGLKARVLQLYGNGGHMKQDRVPDGYKRNAMGHLVPIETIKDEDLMRDELVQAIAGEALLISARLRDFKARVADDIDTFIQLVAEQYGVDLGGRKGNVHLSSFDGRYQVRRAVNDLLEFDEKLQAAKALIDECLREWTRDSRAEIRALIDNAFQVDKKGRINTKRILELRKLDIQDPKWQRAMDAISDSLTVTGSRVYFRIYERDDQGNYKQIPLDFSAV